MVTIIHDYVKKWEGKNREQREGRGQKEKGRRDKNAKNSMHALLWPTVCGGRKSHITSEPPMAIHLLQTHYNIVRTPELKHSEGLRPPLRGGMWGKDRERKERGQGACLCKVSPIHAGHAPLCGSQAPAVGLGDWHPLCRGEGPGSYWQHCRVHLHTLWSSSVATNTKRIFWAAWHLLEWNICLYKWLLCCQHLTRCSQTCVIVGSVMMIICIFNVQTVLKKQPRLNLLGEDFNMFSTSQTSPRK